MFNETEFIWTIEKGTPNMWYYDVFVNSIITIIVVVTITQQYCHRVSSTESLVNLIQEYIMMIKKGSLYLNIITLQYFYSPCWWDDTLKWYDTLMMLLLLQDTYLHVCVCVCVRNERNEHNKLG